MREQNTGRPASEVRKYRTTNEGQTSYKMYVDLEPNLKKKKKLNALFNFVFMCLMK